MSTQPGTAFPLYFCCQFCGSGDSRCWIVTFAAVHAFCDLATRGSICRCATLRSERHAQQCKCVCTLRHSADVCFVCGCRKAKCFAFLSLHYFRVRFVSISAVFCIQLLIIFSFSSSSFLPCQRFIIVCVWVRAPPFFFSPTPIVEGFCVVLFVCRVRRCRSCRTFTMHRHFLCVALL